MGNVCIRPDQLIAVAADRAREKLRAAARDKEILRAKEGNCRTLTPPPYQFFSFFTLTLLL